MMSEILHLNLHRNFFADIVEGRRRRCLERISSLANKNERGKAFGAMSVKTC
jgi:hypothetical protein